MSSVNQKVENKVGVVTPFFRSPFTDLTGGLINAQHFHKCGELEMRMMECLEAYGLNKGNIKCSDLIDDFHECYTMRKQMNRTTAMRLERHRQWWNGERKEHYQANPPRCDSM